MTQIANKYQHARRKSNHIKEKEKEWTTGFRECKGPRIATTILKKDRPDHSHYVRITPSAQYSCTNKCKPREQKSTKEWASH